MRSWVHKGIISLGHQLDLFILFQSLNISFIFFNLLFGFSSTIISFSVHDFFSFCFFLAVFIPPMVAFFLTPPNDTGAQIWRHWRACCLFTMWGHSSKGLSTNPFDKDFLSETDPAGTLIMDLEPQNSEKIHLCCLSSSDCGILFWQLKQIKSVSNPEDLSYRFIKCLKSTNILTSLTPSDLSTLKHFDTYQPFLTYMKYYLAYICF